MLRRTIASDLADEVTDELPVPGAADVVVAYADAGHAIESCVAAVAPGGILYLEVDRVRRGTRATSPRRVAALLRTAGLTASAWYAVEPDLEHARAYVPLHLPQAMSWHRRTQFGDSARLRAADLVRRSAVRVAGPTAGARGRSYVVVAARAPTEPLPASLIDSGVATALGATPAGAVMLTYGGDRVLLFPFATGAREPMGVVKVPKTASLASRTENEQTRMQALRATLDATLAAAIPEPLGTVGHLASRAAMERYCPGVAIAARASDPARELDDKRTDLRLAMDWLARFHRATVTRTATLGSVRGDVLDPLLDAFARELGSAETAPFLQAMRDVAQALGALPINVGCEHRDFAAWNILRDGSSIAVVDWEGARGGFPARDAVHLATTWLYMVRLSDGVRDELRCAHELFVPAIDRDAAAAAAWAALLWYFDEVRIDHRLAPLILATHRIELALRRAAQERLHGEDGRGRESEEMRVLRGLTVDVPNALFPVGTRS